MLFRLFCTFLALAIFPLSSALAAPKAELWDYWALFDSGSTISVDHSPWQRLLNAHLTTSSDGINRLNYGAIKDHSQVELNAYLDSLISVDPRELNRQEQMAFWINLYNALTVKIVVQRYPIKSIKSVRYLSSLFGPWDKKLVKVAGQSVSLNDIEHRILRPIWQDPRIHFVVNCASLGCPNLQPTAFTGENVESLLEASKAQFLAHPRALRLDEDTLILSSLFKWYSVDFGEDTQGVLEYLKSSPTSISPESIDRAGKMQYEYDWRLNSTN